MNEAIFNIADPEAFDSLALETFYKQYESVSVYREFCNILGIKPSHITSVYDIPFLPVELFKTHKIIEEGCNAEVVFESSGTTGMTPSKHYVGNLSLYESSFYRCFSHFMGRPKDLVILALLPSYLERKGSSLVYMVDRLIARSGHPLSGFFLNNRDELVDAIKTCEAQEQPTLLIGVTFALLELAESHSMPLKHTIIMETGGMKGRRKELVREEVHQILKKTFSVDSIYSEYGMTELLSQAYSKGEGRFNCPPWMKVITRDTEDPLSYVVGRTGGLNIIDLANQHSCSFIASQDLGKTYPDGSFEVLGRFDHSDIRGCNLLAL